MVITKATDIEGEIHCPNCGRKVPADVNSSKSNADLESSKDGNRSYHIIM